MTVKSYTKASARSATAHKKGRSKSLKETSGMATSPLLNKNFSVPSSYTQSHLFSSAPQKRSRGLANPFKRNSTIEFRLIFSAAFGLFLLTSVLERALPHKWSGRNEAGELRKSVIEQAREAAHISVGYAFMG